MILVIFILGLCMGSFALAMTSRMHADRNWVSERSACDSCHRTLAWYDLVPLLSWVSTKGHCRYCQKALGRAYPLVELMSGALFALSYAAWPFGFSTTGYLLLAAWLFMLTLLVSLMVFDLNWYILPDKIVFVLVGAAAVQQIVMMVQTRSLQALPGIALGVLVGSGIFMLIYKINNAFIGGGDVKYGLFFGVLLGSGLKSLTVIGFASVLGTLVSLPLVVQKKGGLKMQIPFGPFLIVATIMVYLFGSRILSAYSTLYLFP